ncbi:MAG: hypothetical protein C7B47_14560 [Sulfobacillus thermosulfidooxidans]|uniref:GGDEF domain-containing protein n=1 Tax=Sulfobacillus thermosulfidooxidans TaxID=28034 RepID=A0A2T2WQS4_SULTH|nr:MAG: hypothetical protein C7B47_14560 [Sulfobacillus thermosulfidooxidans]
MLRRISPIQLYLWLLTVSGPALIIVHGLRWASHIWGVVIVGAIMVAASTLWPIKLGQGSITLVNAGYFSVFLIGGTIPAVVAGSLGQMLGWVKGFKGIRSLASWSIFSVSMLAGAYVFHHFSPLWVQASMFSLTFLVINNMLVLIYYLIQDNSVKTWQLFAEGLFFDVLSWVISAPLILIFVLLQKAYHTPGAILAFFPFLLITLLLGLGYNLYRSHKNTLTAVRVAAEIAAAGSPEDVYRSMEKGIRETFPSSVLVMYQKIPHRLAVRRVHVYYPFEEPPPYKEEVLASEGITGWTIESRSSELIDDSEKVVGRFVNPRIPRIMRSVLLLPMVTDRLLIGLMVVAHPEPHQYGPPDLRLGQILATQAAVSLRKIDLLVETRHLSAKDPLLAGLYNFRYFQEALDREMRVAEEEGTDFAVIFFDVDHLKFVNDTYGHLMGDRLLQLVVDTVRLEIREHDVLARYGGDEFILLLRRASQKAAEMAMERIQSKVSQCELDTIPMTLGISVGYAHYPSDGVAVEQLLFVADQRMYQNKVQRRIERGALNGTDVLNGPNIPSENG